MTTSLRKGCIGLAILLGYFLLVSLPCPDGLSPNGKRAIAMMFAAVLVWVFEILPVAVASVLFAVLPAVAGILPLPKMMQLFATPTIFFVFAMFCIAIAFQNSGLSRRIVLVDLSVPGDTSVDDTAIDDTAVSASLAAEIRDRNQIIRQHAARYLAARKHVIRKLDSGETVFTVEGI